MGLTTVIAPLVLLSAERTAKEINEVFSDQAKNAGGAPSAR